jgi:hypothetical protein
VNIPKFHFLPNHFSCRQQITEETVMKIPKQPRVRSTTIVESDKVENVSDPSGNTTSERDYINKRLTLAYSDYLEQANVSGIKAQKEHSKIYLEYLDAIQQMSATSGFDPNLQYWKDLLQADGDMQAIAAAQIRFAESAVAQHSALEKQMSDAANAFSKGLQGIWNKHQSDLREHNSAIVDTLKEALFNADVSPADVPTLALLLQSIKTMTVASAGNAATTD